MHCTPLQSSYYNIIQNGPSYSKVMEPALACIHACMLGKLVAKKSIKKSHLKEGGHGHFQHVFFGIAVPKDLVRLQFKAEVTCMT